MTDASRRAFLAMAAATPALFATGASAAQLSSAEWKDAMGIGSSTALFGESGG